MSVQPTRCLSSYLTTELFKFRNPLGAEENWLPDPQRNAVHVNRHRMIAAEVGAAILCITATIETVAYLILGIGLIPLAPISSAPTTRCFKLVSSSSFTVFWNFGNLTTFNPSFTHVFTNESFARFSIDHMPQGDAYRFVLAMVYIPLIFLSAVTRTAPPLIHLDNFFGLKSRPEDDVYIADWLNAHPFHHPVLNPNILSPQLQHFGNAADKIRDSVKDGADFFTEFILEPGQIDDHSREQVLDCDPDIYLFILVRSVYIYVFGPKYDEPPPSFFKLQTRQNIEMLRQKYANTKDKIDDLDPLVKNLTAFETPHHNSQVRSILLDLKGTAHLEMQNSLFMTHCWQKACNE